MEELDERFKRLEAILIKLIDQQKKMQIEQKGIEKSYKGLVDIISKLMNKNSGNGFKNKLEKFIKNN
jgi:flagellar basal body-associated protein FliL